MEFGPAPLSPNIGFEEKAERGRVKIMTGIETVTPLFATTRQLDSRRSFAARLPHKGADGYTAEECLAAGDMEPGE